MPDETVTVQVDDRTLRLSNLGKTLYPDGFTKGAVIDYYTRIAPVILPHLRGRPVTFVRFPNGVGSPSFFEKNASRNAPSWVRTARLPAPGSSMNRSTIDYVLLDELPSLVWAANLAALELHVPQWTVNTRGKPAKPDRIVIDLDPGAPATIVECCRVALLVRAELGPTAVAKTSGSKGLQVYARWDKRGDTHEFARQLAERLAAEQPELVVSTMTKSVRGGRVLLDWSQNHPAKTTVAPYSLRGRDVPSVSTPVTWDEVAACRKPADLTFLAADVLDRVAKHGDLFAPLLGEADEAPAEGRSRRCRPGYATLSAVPADPAASGERRAGRPGPRPRLPRHARRAQLLEAAQEIFVAQGYHAAAMDAIAERASVSKPVLYQHFPGKLELYLALLDRSADDLVAGVRQALHSTTDNHQRVAGAVTAYFEFVDGAGAHRLVFESDLRSEPLVAARVERMLEEAVAAIADTIAADTGVDHDEARLLSVGLAGMAEVAARWWLAASDSVSKQRAVELLTQLVWRGISGSPRRA